MLPNISPPTDNLYKFIALFGLAIFLFSLYKSGDAFEAVTKSKLERSFLSTRGSKTSELDEGHIVKHRYKFLNRSSILRSLTAHNFTSVEDSISVSREMT